MNENNKISNGTRKGIIFGFLIIFLLPFTTKTVWALSNFLSQPQFGGRIINTTAIEIQELEMAGFQCVVPGSTISIAPLGSPVGTPTSYFIPFGTFSKTGYSPRVSQLIIGKYGWKTTIPCTSATVPPIVTTVWLDTINLFGNSR